MKNDYVGFNEWVFLALMLCNIYWYQDSKGEKVTAKAHGGQINIEGVTVAKVDDKVRLQSVETWFDPLEMFRQIAPNGIVNKTIVTPAPGQDVTSQLFGDDNEDTEGKKGVVTASSSGTEEMVSAEKDPKLAPGNAVVEPSSRSATLDAHAEMSNITPAECPFLMNKE
jgi:hypothetical protein